MDTSRYPTNTIVEGRVDTVQGNRVFLRLGRNDRAILREPEMGWSFAERARLLQQLKQDATLRVKVIGKRGECVDVSTRMLDRDPWDDIHRRYAPGSLVRGKVYGLNERAVFVELEDGVVAELPEVEFGIFEGQAARNEFQVGDTVVVSITWIEPDRRHISLTLKGVRKRRWDPAVLRSLSTPGDASRSENPDSDDLSALQSADFDKRYAFLLVDDHLSEVNSLRRHLERAGQRVYEAGDVKQAHESLANLVVTTDNICVLMDWHMPGENGADGILRLRPVFPNVRFGLMTNAPALPEAGAAPGGDIEVFQKPLRRSDLRLLTSRTPPEQTATKNETIGSTTERAPLVRLSSQLPLQEFVERVRKLARAQGAILFCVSTVRDVVKIEAQTHDLLVDPRQLPLLIYSPVRDTIAREQPYVCADARQAIREVTHLRAFTAFSACIGVNVPVDGDTAYALFVFFERSIPNNDPTLPFTLEMLRTSAEGIAARIARQEFENHLADRQRMIVAGELMSAVAHDIREPIGRMRSALRDLEQGLSEMNSETASNWRADGAASLMKEIIHLRDSLDRIDRASTGYRQFSIQTKSSHLRVDEIAEEAAELGRKTAWEHGADIEFVAPTHLVVTSTNSPYLQRILQNLLQNAAQQFEVLRSRLKGEATPATGKIRLSIRENARDPDRGPGLIQLRIEDDGPGIHAADFEWIFRLGTTTRKKAGGSGIGLYVCRVLARELGATVRLEDSAIGWGSVFVVELP